MALLSPTYLTSPTTEGLQILWDVAKLLRDRFRSQIQKFRHISQDFGNSKFGENDIFTHLGVETTHHHPPIENF